MILRIIRCGLRHLRYRKKNRSFRTGIAFAKRATCLLGIMLLVSCSKTEHETSVSAPGIDSDPSAISNTITFRDASDLLSEPVIYQSGAVDDQFSILQSLGGGVSVFDYDGDGLLDLCFAGGGTIQKDRISGLPPLLFRRSESGFLNSTQVASLDTAINYSHGCIAGDYDNDGFMDIAITGYGQTLLCRNQGDGTFTSTADAMNDCRDRWTSSAGWGDVNGDGNLDLYAACYVNWTFGNNPSCTGPSGRQDVCPPRQFDGLDDILLLNGGHGDFQDIGRQVGLAPKGKGLGVVLADLDQDDDLDIYVANDTTANFYYRNNGQSTFEEVGLLSGLSVDELANATGSMGIAVSDCDLDGLPDVWVTNYEDELLGLYRNLGDLGFLCISSQTIGKVLAPRNVSFGCVTADFDLDGDEDLGVSNGHIVEFPSETPVRQTPFVLRNDRDLHFARVLSKEGDPLAEPYLGRGLATGDFNRDGKPDLIFANSDEAAVLALNETVTDGSSIIVDLIGVTSNRNAVGARVILQTNRGRQLRHFVGGGSYLSTSDRRIHFGFAATEYARQLEIHWPTGQTQTVDIMTAAGTKHVKIRCIEGGPHVYIDAL
ncbi:MAG: CRTAC1 family protein [Rhodopirellula sp.]|nr:CRTAC1 family protein [Rhodopirellula sp.]